MNRNRIWVISTLTVLILTACNRNSSTPNTTTSTPETTITTSPENRKIEASPVPSTRSETQSGFTRLKNVVAQTKSAVDANNFVKAKQEFGEFEEYWEKVEDGVKAKSADTYKAIENDMDNITNGLRSQKPDKTKVLADLQSLSKTLNSYQ